MSGRKGRTGFLNVAVFIGLEVAALCLLASGSEVRHMWLGRWYTDIQAFIWEKADGIRHFTGLKEENERLSKENALLLDNALKNSLPQAAADSTRLNARVHYSILDAKIVTMTFRSQHNYLIVDRGAVDGVQQDDGIITAKGVIGVVTGVSRHFCYAVSYANQNMTISVRHGHSGLVGSLNWDGIHSDISILSGIPIHAVIEPGDTIYTSGFSSIFPPDIPVGIIDKEKGGNGSTSDYFVRLSENFRKVSRVMVVKNLDREEINSLKDDKN